MTEETWILQQCARPKCYGTLCGNLDSESNQLFATYIVKASDTLTSIAVRNDISVGQLKFLNRMLLSGDKSIVPGTVLRLPITRKLEIRQATPQNVPDNTAGLTTQVSDGKSTFSGSADVMEHQSLLMMDPLVDTITSSHSLHKDQSSSSADAV
ncbi:peptidoglycan binding lysin domain [Echinococcus multilocularis]|uniref:Peptidoglycan binding lysin subgroup n=1 Tax=Echinococcus multilocularis TaxID=6211 RepID=A0A068XZR1_ECHMU|nr:peptidoglycan binding lysin domain [Echinococcus multilocularis]